MQGIQILGGGGGAVDLREFAARSSEIEITRDMGNTINIGGGGGDLDDLGLGFLANQNKISVNRDSGSYGGSRQDTAFSSRSIGGGNGSTGNSGGSISFNTNDSMNIKPIDDLEFVSLNDMPNTSTDRISFAPSNNGPPSPILNPAPAIEMKAEARMSPEQEITEKASYLTKLQRLSGKGIQGQRLTMGNSLDEIKAEFEKLVDSRNLETSLKFQRNAMMTFVTGLEFVNNRFNPVEVKLDGWSESVHENIEDFDEIFEELFDKYKSAAKTSPEIRLGLTLMGSAAMYHITNTYMKSRMPGIDDILRNNPEMARQFAQAAATQASPGLGNFMGLAMDQGRRSSEARQAAPASSEPGGRGSRQQEMGFNQQPARREMRGPTNVDDILAAFENDRSDLPLPNIAMETAPIFPPSGNPPPSATSNRELREGVGSDNDPLREVASVLDDIQSLGTVSTMNGDARRRRGRRSQLPAGETITLSV